MRISSGHVSGHPGIGGDIVLFIHTEQLDGSCVRTFLRLDSEELEPFIVLLRKAGGVNHGG